MLKDMGDSLIRLYDAVRDSRGKDTAASRTARLLHAGPRKIAKKVAEEFGVGESREVVFGCPAQPIKSAFKQIAILKKLSRLKE